MKWLVLNTNGERIWVDEPPLWRIDKDGKEMNTGFLRDGTKVKRATTHDKNKTKPSKYALKRPVGRPRKS